MAECTRNIDNAKILNTITNFSFDENLKEAKKTYD